MHIYAFGSICRGDIRPDSDVDLLAIVEGHDARLNPDCYSVYSYKRIREIWGEGNPFAWHLSLESKMIYSSNGQEFLRALGVPQKYRHALRDCEKFFALFNDTCRSLNSDRFSVTFDLSTAFLAIRNLATCFSLGCLPVPEFSRHSALRLGADKLAISLEAYDILERSRILCTRGRGTAISQREAELAQTEFPVVARWMEYLVLKARTYES